MSKFNTKNNRVSVSNLAGGEAFSMSAKQELVHAVLNTFLENKAYESGDDRIKRIVKLVSEVPHEFTAKLAVIARTEFHLRSVSHLLVGELAKIHKGDSLVMNTILATAIRPDDILEIAAYVGNPFPKQLKRGARNAILKWNRYQLAKYKGEGKSVSMVDLFNIVHPKAQFATDEQKKAWKDLMNGELPSFDTWETEISNTRDKKAAWEALVRENKLGYMALLRNLNNLISNNVSEDVIDLAVQKLTDREEVLRSKQLPFRFSTAYKTVSGNRKFTDAISVAMDIALSNVPIFDGKTLVAIDTSGSMSGNPIEKGSIFAAVLAKSQNSDLVQFSDSCVALRVNSATPVVDMAEYIQRKAIHGGTSTGSVFDYAAVHKKKYDRVVIISDNESWNGSAQRAYESYKKIANPFVFAIDIAGYGTTDLIGGRVAHIGGWSARMLDFIGMLEKGSSLVSYVDNFQIHVGSQDDVDSEEE